MWDPEAYAQLAEGLFLCWMVQKLDIAAPEGTKSSIPEFESQFNLN